MYFHTLQNPEDHVMLLHHVDFQEFKEWVHTNTLHKLNLFCSWQVLTSTTQNPTTTPIQSHTPLSTQ